jgi:ABC-type transport system substrate-binding protein
MSEGRDTEMKQHIRALVVVGGLLTTMSAAAPTFAQKQGGILKLSHFDSPASMSILEESTRAALQPAMGIFNNLVMYKQDMPQTSLQSVVPDLATAWSWNEDPAAGQADHTQHPRLSGPGGDPDLPIERDLYRR